jgi:sec-independent protein translocase protein TatA
VPNIGFGEILVIALLALIIFGPRRLPEMGRTIGRSLREFRRTTSELRSEFQADMDEPPTTTVEERARRIAERKRRPPADESPGPTEGDAPPA